MRDEFGRSLDDLGFVLAAIFGGFGPATALHPRLLPRVGIGRLVIIGGIVAALGLLVVATAPSWWIVLAGYVVLGAGNGLIDPSVNLYLALNHGVRSLGLLHASFGVGATLGPIVMTASLGSGWRTGYLVLLGVELAVIAALVAARSRWAPIDRTAEPIRIRASAPTLLAMAVFALYTGTEIAGGQWAFSLLTEERGLGDGLAGVIVSLYWGGITAGRLLQGAVGHRFAPQRLLAGSFVVAAAGFGIVWAAGSPAFAAVGFAVAGLGFSGVFPLLVLLTPDRVGRDRAGDVMGIQFTAAATGAVTLPWIIGIIAERTTLEAVPPLLIVLVVIAAGVNAAIGRVRAR